MKSILFVSSENSLSTEASTKLLSIVELCTSSNKEVHIFKEDLVLWDLLRNVKGVKFIKGLSSGADLLLFNKKYAEDHYSANDEITSVSGSYEDIYKKAISRHAVPDKSTMYDETEYNSVRLSIVFRRLRYVISAIAGTYPFVINFKDRKDLNLLNELSPTYGDGKFIYNYDCIKNKSELSIGGCTIPEKDIELCIRGY